MKNKMTPEKALEILNHATNELHLKRIEHITIMEALEVLKELVDKNNIES